MVDVQAAVLGTGQEGVGEGAGQVLHLLDRLQLMLQQWLGPEALVAVGVLVGAVLRGVAAPNPACQTSLKASRSIYDQSTASMYKRGLILATSACSA